MEALLSTNDEVRRKLLKPKITEEEALSLLYDFYVADGFNLNDTQIVLPRAQVLQELVSYDDANFVVKVDGKKALLKIYNGVESEKYIAKHARKRARIMEESEETIGGCVIDLHTAIYERLSDPKYNVTTGKNMPVTNTLTPDENDNNTTSDDNTVCIRELSVVSADQGPQQLVVRLQSWIYGTPLCDVKYFPIETLLDAGAWLGRMDSAFDELATSDPETLHESKRYFAWDGRNFADARSFIDHIDDNDKKQLVTNVLDTFQKTLKVGKEDEKLRMGINHGDFNDGNLIVGNDMLITGVIDFGDCVHSWRVLDVTTAMTYAALTTYGKGKRSISASCAILRGYHHKYPLTHDERKHLRLLMACRLSMSAIMGNYSYKQNPDPYLLLHSQPAWETLNLIWGVDGKGLGGITAEVVDKAFNVACDDIHIREGSDMPDFADLCFPDPPILDPFASAR